MVMRRCSACGEEKPETTEFFTAHRECRGGLHTQCKECHRVRGQRSRWRKVHDTLTEKVCTLCSATKPATVEFFYPTRNGTGGFTSACKACSSARSKEKYARNREVMLARGRAANAKHGAKWRENARTKHWITSMLAVTKASARRRELSYDLNEGFVRELWEKQGGRCYWFGVPIIPSGTHRDPQRPSLDRLDNDKGYVRDNVVLCCMSANLGRSESTAERFREFVTMLLGRQVELTEGDGEDVERLFNRLSAIVVSGAPPTVQ